MRVIDAFSATGVVGGVWCCCERYLMDTTKGKGPGGWGGQFGVGDSKRLNAREKKNRLVGETKRSMDGRRRKKKTRPQVRGLIGSFLKGS